MMNQLHHSLQEVYLKVELAIIQIENVSPPFSLLLPTLALENRSTVSWSPMMVGLYLSTIELN